MFLDVTRRRNPKLVETAKTLHKQGQILPNTYVLDLDAIMGNASLLKDCAEKADITLFFMLKQIGRNPLVAKNIQKCGIDKAVAVDYTEALTMMENDIPLGNVGHLVQIPQNLLEKIICYKPDYITVYSLGFLQKIEYICKKHGIRQNILLKILESDNVVYEGQYGGFRLDELTSIAKEKLEYANIVGLTSFPCLIFDAESKLSPTCNVDTLYTAKKILMGKGLVANQLNLPSATCCETIPLLKHLGATQCEPGHALTGTTPLHSIRDLPELPAILYVSEISHHYCGSSYFYGGGYYRRGHFENILVDDGKTEILASVTPFSSDNIDYHMETKGHYNIGATVLGAFRTQIFTTRSDVAVVSGIQSEKPKIEGIFDSLGRRIQR